MLSPLAQVALGTIFATAVVTGCYALQALLAQAFGEGR